MYLPLDLPQVDEVLAQLGRQQVLPAEDGQGPGGAVPPPVGQQAGAAVQVEHGAVPQLGAGVTAHYHLQRSRHVGSGTHAGNSSSLLLGSYATSFPGICALWEIRDWL